VSIEIKQEEENRSQGLFTDMPSEKEEIDDLAKMHQALKSMNWKVNVMAFVMIISIICWMYSYREAKLAQENIDNTIQNTEQDQQQPPD
jgi:hypothetical protein